MDWIDRVVQDVAELSDRDSPEDWPEAMLVTGEELRSIIELRAPASTGENWCDVQRLQARIEKATHWAEHAMLMRSSQNKELLGILRGADQVPNASNEGPAL